jgi:hypothetical protein
MMGHLVRSRLTGQCQNWEELWDTQAGVCRDLENGLVWKPHTLVLEGLKREKQLFFFSGAKEESSKVWQHWVHSSRREGQKVFLVFSPHPGHCSISLENDPNFPNALMLWLTLKPSRGEWTQCFQPGQDLCSPLCLRPCLCVWDSTHTVHCLLGT